MASCLFVVEDVFQIFGLGVILIPGLKPIEKELFQVGDQIELRKPDSTQAMGSIDGFEFPYPNPNKWALILLKGMSKWDPFPPTYG